VRASTSSQITASAGDPVAASTARLASVEIVESTESIEIEPARSSPSRRSWSTTTLTSSRATSQPDEVHDCGRPLQDFEHARRFIPWHDKARMDHPRFGDSMHDGDRRFDRA
jgi:hypothetical protein